MFRSRMIIVSRLPLSIALLLSMIAIGTNTAGAQRDVQCGDPIEASATPAAASDGWQTLPEMPRPRSEFAAAVIDDWIYVVGGFGGLAHMDCFQPGSGTWSTGPDLLVGVHHPGVTVLDGLIYVAGGYTEEGPSTDALRVYDPETGVWEERAPMPTSRGALGLAAYDGKLYAIGGATERLGGPVTGAVEIYDPATETWSTGADMPTPREHLAVVAAEGQIYTVGGRANGDDDEHLSGVAEVYDPAIESWQSLPSLPTPRGGLSGVYVDGLVVVLGGERGTTTYDAVEAFDIASGTWSQLPPLPTPRHGIASAAIGDTIYAVAGSTLGGRIENTGETNALTLPATNP